MGGSRIPLGCRWVNNGSGLWSQAPPRRPRGMSENSLVRPGVVGVNGRVLAAVQIISPLGSDSLGSPWRTHISNHDCGIIKAPRSDLVLSRPRIVVLCVRSESSAANEGVPVGRNVQGVSRVSICLFIVSTDEMMT